MKIAVNSDIHSNIYALDEVLDDIEAKDVDMTVCTGDLVGYGTKPNEILPNDFARLIREGISK